MSDAYARLFVPLVACLFVALAVGCSPEADPDDSVLLGDVGPGADGGGNTGDAGDVEPPPPAPDCVELLPLRLWKSDPSAVAMLFTAEDCETGEAYAHFDESAFAIAEDGQGLSSEAVPRILPSEGLRVYVTLMLDLSGSTAPNLAELQAGARRFVDEILVEQALDNVYIGLEAFDGSETPHELEKPTRDAAKLKATIDGLSEFDAPDPGATNLHGATRQGVQNLQAHQQRVMELNYDGVVTTGYLVLFTDGGDTAQREDATGATRAVAAARIYDAAAGAQPTVRTLAVALKGQDYAPSALSTLVGGPRWVSEADLAELGETFQKVGRQIARRVRGTYLLAYCSASRAGDHEVTLRLAAQESNALSFGFSAEGFAGGCSAEFFETACQSRQCGGFNCGACADEREYCDGADSGQCVDACLDQNKCSGERVDNRLGYEQVCDFGAEVYRCGGQCVDTSQNDAHCGRCGNTCRATGSRCVGGQCICDAGGLACGARCVDPTSDPNHCGSCGNRCPRGASCSQGQCACDNGGIVCGGTCVDETQDPDHCGACGNVCSAVGSQCDDGQCACASGGIVCNGVCVDKTNDPSNCGACGNVCPTGGSCVAGRCECPSGQQTDCNGRCVDTTNDPNHCGQCGHACGADERCASGTCTCQAGLTRCGGECLDVQSNTLHCGQCGSSCTENRFCDGRVCLAPNISTQENHVCAVKNNGSIVCWGYNRSGQTDSPTGTFAQVSAGGSVSCGLKTDGSVACWGGINQTLSAPPGKFTHLATGPYYACGLKPNGTVFCWSENGYVPFQQPKGTFTQVELGLNHGCGVKTNGTVECWGASDRYGSTKAPTGTFNRVSTGNFHSCGLKTNGTVQCWGRNDSGQATPPPGTFNQISTGRSATCGVQTDRTVVCWGASAAGYLAAPAGKFLHVSVGRQHACGLKADRTVICWGRNSLGQLNVPAGL